jgi:hypothetical protein
MLEYRSFFVKIGFAVLALAVLASPAAAQSTNARPVIVMNTAAVDPASLTILDDGGRKALGDMAARLKSGAIFAYVMSISANGKSWAFASETKVTFLNLEDIARTSLERCEYTANASCIIVSISGHDARTADGGWPSQPRMLERAPGAFDAMRVPFLSLANRTLEAGYGRASGPRAYVITSNGGAVWHSGKTIFEAIASADASCRKAYPGLACILYAVNDRVVFTQ